MIYLGKIGGLFGWITIILFCATLLNFILKFINKKFSKQIAQNQSIKPIFSFLTKLFVRYHRVWGLLTVITLITHFLIQFNTFGVSISGGAAASILFTQVFLGLYGTYKAKNRKGIWFVSHRFISILLILAIFVHLM